MKLARKTIITIISLALIFSISVFGTIAYLTDKEEVTNTFSVGKVEIDVNETKVNEDGQPLDKDGNVDDLADTVPPADPVQQNNYKLVPGKTYTKDPTMTLKSGSEESYVRMMLTFSCYEDLNRIFTENGKASFLHTDMVNINPAWLLIPASAEAAGKIDTTADTVTYEYRYVGNPAGDGKVSAETADNKLEPLFDTLSVPTYFDGEDLAALASFKMDIVGHAIQAETFADAASAWTAFDAQMNP